MLSYPNCLLTVRLGHSSVPYHLVSPRPRPATCTHAYNHAEYQTQTIIMGGGGGVSRWFTPLAWGPGHPELSKSFMDTAGKVFTFTFTSCRRAAAGCVPLLLSSCTPASLTLTSMSSHHLKHHPRLLSPCNHLPEACPVDTSSPSSVHHHMRLIWRVSTPSHGLAGRDDLNASSRNGLTLAAPFHTPSQPTSSASTALLTVLCVPTLFPVPLSCTQRTRPVTVHHPLSGPALSLFTTLSVDLPCGCTHIASALLRHTVHSAPAVVRHAYTARPQLCAVDSPATLAV